MAEKDKRTKVVNELLNGFKVSQKRMLVIHMRLWPGRLCRW